MTKTGSANQGCLIQARKNPPMYFDLDKKQMNLPIYVHESKADFLATLEPTAAAQVSLGGIFNGCFLARCLSCTLC
jgi:hypothetical protein